jgi:membrane associated rhomboid family serine protease
MSRRRYAPARFRFWRFDMPLTVGILCILTIVASIVAAWGGHNNFPLASWSIFIPDHVWHGQLWRLVSWIFFEIQHPWDLVFGVLMLYWFGRDLADDWGSGRFLAVYLGLAAAGAAVACLVGRFLWHTVLLTPYFGNWAVIDALIIAWAMRYPTREIRLYFLFPIAGRALVYITLIGTTLFALYYGFSNFVPHFAAEAIVLGSALRPRRWWLRFRQARLKSQMRRYVNNVRRIDGSDVDQEDDDEDDDGAPPPPRKWVN